MQRWEEQWVGPNPAGTQDTHAPHESDWYAHRNSHARTLCTSPTTDFHNDAEPDNRLSFHIDQP